MRLDRTGLRLEQPHLSRCDPPNFMQTSHRRAVRSAGRRALPRHTRTCRSLRRARPASVIRPRLANRSSPEQSLNLTQSRYSGLIPVCSRADIPRRGGAAASRPMRPLLDFQTRLRSSRSLPPGTAVMGGERPGSFRKWSWPKRTFAVHRLHFYLITTAAAWCPA